MAMNELKLFMLMLGCTPPGRHIEQHDIFFGIATSLHELVPEIKAFWPEPDKIHIDAWREVNTVEGYRVNVVVKAGTEQTYPEQKQKLFFINLGGYQQDKFEEQHYVLLTVKEDRAAAFATAKETLFFQHNHFTGANTHIDDKYGIDVDDLYEIADILSPAQKEKYQLRLVTTDNPDADPINLGYLKLSRLAQGVLTTE